MFSLSNSLNSLNFSTQLSAVKDLIDSAQAKTTFWGSRVVERKGFRGSVYLDDIVKKIFVVGRQRANAENLTPAERIAGVEIARKLDNFYRITDTQIKNSNFFTRFLNWLREFSILPYTTRFYFEEETEKNFRAFSETKFLQQFGGKFEKKGFEDHYHSAAENTISGSSFLLVVAKEEHIRALLIPA